MSSPSLSPSIIAKSSLLPKTARSSCGTLWPTIVPLSWDWTVKIWNLTNCKIRASLAGHSGYVNTVAVSPDGSLCASGGKDGVILLWIWLRERSFTRSIRVLQLRAPIKIFGDLHGQFGDLMRLFDEYGSPSTAGDIAVAVVCLDLVMALDYLGLGVASVSLDLPLVLSLNKNANLKAHAVKNHLWVFVNALIDKPAFDSQTKKTLTIRQSSFGSKCELSQEFLKKVSKSGIVESLLSWANFKQSKDLKKTDGTKRQRITRITKLEDANDAGGKSSDKCTLILTEGVSAKALAISRSIGDVYLKKAEFNREPLYAKFRLREPFRRPILSAEPSICVHELQPDDRFLIFASDGLWEHLSNQEAVDIVQNHPCNVPRQRYCPPVEVFKSCCREVKKGCVRPNSSRYYLSFVDQGGEGNRSEPVEPHLVVQMDTESSVLYQKTCLDYCFEKPIKVPYITTALMDAKLGTEGRKDLFDWLSRQLSGLSNFPDAVNLNYVLFQIVMRDGCDL
ncbi:hypothetical protein TEA_004794 [Camellia sinensis var. sinensis]|uniref:DNA topoisomerase 2 n=1 Tax=Camellia sinensis var. sinensis TaxID=542762 RepID=A0A4S4DHA2_CAMSN|nr:hypothetical protein TEA_004794 [Camellia sinensis var. sinensis]